MDTTPIQSSDKHRKIAAQIREWWLEADNHFSKYAEEMMVDWDYYDSDQLTPEELNILRVRKQPKTVINKIKVGIELVLGIFDRTLTDAVPVPRGTYDDDWMDAQALTHTSKWVEDVNHSRQHTRDAFLHQCVSGMGWYEVALNPDPAGEEVWENFVDWRDIRYDPHHRRRDYSDARYLFRARWLDVEEAIAIWPDYKTQLQDAMDSRYTFDMGEGSTNVSSEGADYSSFNGAHWRSSEWVNRKDRRVLILECYYYTWTPNTHFLKDLRDGSIREFDPDNMTPLDEQLLLQAVSGNIPLEVVKGPAKKCRKAMLAGPILLEDEPLPYEHNRIPIIPFWGWRKFRDNQPYGLVRLLRDPQDAANRALSKLVHALATRQLLMESEVGDVEVLRKEVARPDGVLQFKRNALKEGRVRIESNLATAQMHMGVFEEVSRVMADLSGGLELAGQATNAESGRAIALRQEQGNATLSTLFNNFYLGKRLVVEQRIALIMQYYTSEKWIRLSETPDGRPGVMVLNESITDETGTIGVRNQLNLIKADVVIDQQASRESVRQSFADRLMDLSMKMPPEVMLMIMDLVVDLYDVPNRPQLRQRIQMMQQMLLGIKTAEMQSGAGGAQQQQTASQQPDTKGLSTLPAEQALGLQDSNVISRMSNADATAASQVQR